jgi:hypothetical protein
MKVREQLLVLSFPLFLYMFMELNEKISINELEAYLPAVSSAEVRAERNGRILKTSCPLHIDLSHSLRVDLSTGKWSCVCQPEGAAIEIFEMRRTGVDPCPYEWTDAAHRIITIARKAGATAHA